MRNWLEKLYHKWGPPDEAGEQYCTVCGAKEIFQKDTIHYAFGALSGKPLYRGIRQCPNRHETGDKLEQRDSLSGLLWIITGSGYTGNWLIGKK